MRLFDYISKFDKNINGTLFWSVLNELTLVSQQNFPRKEMSLRQAIRVRVIVHRRARLPPVWMQLQSNPWMVVRNIYLGSDYSNQSTSDNTVFFFFLGKTFPLPWWMTLVSERFLWLVGIVGSRATLLWYSPSPNLACFLASLALRPLLGRGMFNYVLSLKRTLFINWIATRLNGQTWNATLRDLILLFLRSSFCLNPSCVSFFFATFSSFVFPCFLFFGLL